MGTIKSDAEEYVPKETKVISDLPEVSVNLDTQDGEGMDRNGKEFNYKFTEINGEEYRIPGTVFGQLKDILEAKPDTKTFKVKKKGEGKLSKYTVIPLS